MARLLRVILSLSFLVPVCGFPQRRVQPADGNVSTVQALTRSSGYIFSGTVMNVEGIPARDPSQVAVMRITFRVDRAVRGVRTGQFLVIREWAGLWQAGERYRRGERVFLFLYPPSKLGLTSPVNGAIGQFAVDRDGAIVLPAQEGEPSRVPGSAGIPEGPRVSPREFTRMIRQAERERP